jgi:hypothetical protein
MTAPSSGWIQTVSGRRFYPLEPRRQDIHLPDIAHALSNLCRFTGHTREFYSVAQHCCHVHDEVRTKDRAWGLLHDAGEAYLNDVATPVKRSAQFRGYTEAEQVLMRHVSVLFGLEFGMPPGVHEADVRMLFTEKRDLLVPMVDGTDWSRDAAEPYPWKVVPWSPTKAFNEFMYRARELFPAHHFED